MKIIYKPDAPFCCYFCDRLTDFVVETKNKVIGVCGIHAIRVKRNFKRKRK